MADAAMQFVNKMNMPGWVPDAACRYLEHTERGVSIRALARKEACHPSTVLRQVRRFENLRDDFLIDEALRQLGRKMIPAIVQSTNKNGDTMGIHIPEADMTTPDDETLNREARRVLRRLCEPGAVLAVSADMDKAVVVRDREGGQSTRTAVVERTVAQALALKDWITCSDPGRIARYHITAAGRSALSRIIAEAENAAQGFAEAQSPFGAQHSANASANASGKDIAAGQGTRRRLKAAFGESPLTALSRRRDRDGDLFLRDTLVAAGERLREDFELAQMGARLPRNWEAFFLKGKDKVEDKSDASGSDHAGSAAARDRLKAALRELGPGLGDVALSCCCYLEGLETTEKQLGWSARSGKIVLRIALQRLLRHYETLGAGAAMIG
ncbi:DUF6456 domain-containing protein [Rhodobacteraceae bacterium D3-12]|nr:DUF6456 domain-containing protein [Rhodobacteraceae bacterium D3-12]